MRDTSGKKRDKVLPRSNRSKDNKRTYLSRRIIIRISYPRLEVKPLEQCLAHESCSSINSSYYLKQEMSISTIWKKYAGGTLKKKKRAGYTGGIAHLLPMRLGLGEVTGHLHGWGYSYLLFSRVCPVEEATFSLRVGTSMLSLTLKSTRRDSENCNCGPCIKDHQ